MKWSDQPSWPLRSQTAPSWLPRRNALFEATTLHLMLLLAELPPC